MTSTVNEQTAVTEPVSKSPITIAKKSRRGIGSARGTTRLKFDHKMALPNGLFLGHIDEVSVKMVKIGEETSGMPSFNGLEVPRLSIVFASNEPNANDRKYNTLSFMAQESNAETIPNGDKEWTVNRIFDYMKHVLNVFVLKGRELTEEEEIALSLPFEDFDDNGDYVPLAPETVIEGWAQVFNNFATILNTYNNGAPAFYDKAGKPLQVYAKMLRAVKSKKGWQNVTNGDLAFPSFVAEGVFEIYKPNIAPNLRIDIVRESITPKVIETNKKPNMPAMPGMTAAMPTGYSNVGISDMGGIQDPMAGPDGIGITAMEDSPF